MWTSRLRTRCPGAVGRSKAVLLCGERDAPDDQDELRSTEGQVKQKESNDQTRAMRSTAMRSWRTLDYVPTSGLTHGPN